MILIILYLIVQDVISSFYIIIIKKIKSILALYSGPDKLINTLAAFISQLGVKSIDLFLIGAQIHVCVV